MSLISIGLNLLLAGLLIAALAYGRRLEARLKAVREGQLAFARAVAELDVAAGRARQGLDELRAAADEATDLLGGRVTRAREAAERLERLIGRAEALPEPQAQAQAEGGLAALLSRLNGREASPEPAQRTFEPRRRPARVGLDEELFAEPGGLA